MKLRFNIIGMSCAACSSNIEKAVSKLKGVQNVQVNLLKNDMIVEFNEDEINQKDIIKAVQKIGHDANIEKQSKLSSSEIINLHSQPQYLIYMLGFLPGFAYLGGLDERLATPRLANPRLKINPGSVGIAGTQTGMYPIESPGGWQIIGRTPLQLFQPSADDPFYYSAGDYIKFDAITVSEYQAIQHDVEQHQYQIEVEKEK